MMELAALKIDMRIARPMMRGRLGCPRAVTAVTATRFDAAIPFETRAARYTKLASRQIAIRAGEPIRNASGNSRRGFTDSPALKVAYCQPSYAHKTLIIAKPKPEKSEPPVVPEGPEVLASTGYFP